MWGWGVMNQVAIQEAVNIKFPMENFIGIWWSGADHDVAPAGAAANGYKALTFHAVGNDFPVFADIQKYVVDTGKAACAGDNVGKVLYNRGMYAAFLAAEAVKTAQAATGHGDITAGEMRDGMEALNVTEASMAAAGMPGFGPEFQVSCANHGGPGSIAVQQLDASTGTWSLISEFMTPDQDVIQPLIAEDSTAFAAENKIEMRACN
jgi:branched-chain amino acid transport system substrate-binding protein